MPDNYYIVKNGDTITDCVMNSTGDITNWQLILDANGFDDWVPVLTVGQQIIIPDTVVKNNNVIRELAKYPANNAGPNNLQHQIDEFINILNSRWILATGRWNNLGIWLLTGRWKTA